jgi:CSLREA domain-containing protein
VEVLEDRLAPAVITVTSAADDSAVDGTVSLREAILSINQGSNFDADVAAVGAYGNHDTIDFDIPGPVIQTISVGSGGLGALPAITRPVTIDGSSQPASGGAPVIILNGSQAPLGANGLDLRPPSGGVTVKRLVINGFQGNGILIEPNDGTGFNTIIGNYVGTDSDGSADPMQANQLNGVFIDGNNTNNVPGTQASNNVITNNLISNNRLNGVLIQAANGVATGNVVTFNLIGTGPESPFVLQAEPNQGAGVRIDSASQNVLGGTTAADRNVISFNGEAGVRIVGTVASPAEFNIIRGNFIGVGSSGNLPPIGSGTHGFSLQLFGVEVSGGDHNIIGGSSPGRATSSAATSRASRSTMAATTMPSRATFSEWLRTE